MAKKQKIPAVLDAFRPPRGLSRAAAALWRKLRVEYDVEDGGGLSVLELHCRALDTEREASRILKRDGLTVADRWGQPRPHPAAAIMRDARAQMLATLRAMSFDVIPKHDHVGRPGGGE